MKIIPKPFLIPSYKGYYIIKYWKGLSLLQNCVTYFGFKCVLFIMFIFCLFGYNFSEVLFISKEWTYLDVRTRFLIRISLIHPWLQKWILSIPPLTASRLFELRAKSMFCYRYLNAQGVCLCAIHQPFRRAQCVPGGGRTHRPGTDPRWVHILLFL